MEATVFNSQETPSGLFTLGELETEESSGKVASWEFATALSLLTKDWVRSVDHRTQIVDRLRHKYEDHVRCSRLIALPVRKREWTTT